MNDEQLSAITGDTPPKVVMDKEALRRFKAHEHIKDLEWLLSATQGKRLMLGWLGLTNFASDGFDSDALRMAYMQGKRAIGIALLADIQHNAPDFYADLMTQAAK